MSAQGIYLQNVKTGYWHTILSETSVNDPHVVGIPILIISLKDAYEKKAVRKFYEVLTRAPIS